MPKTTKRAETKRSARIARLHSTEIPELEVMKKSSQRSRSSGQKAPTRGLARYPWAITLILLIAIVGIIALYANHVGPFALPKPKPGPNVQATATAGARASATALTSAQGTATAQAAVSSPCLAESIVKSVTDTSPAPSADEISKTQHTYTNAPAMSIDTKKIYCAGINTSRGLILVELDPYLAPGTVNNFVYLAQHHFYDGLTFHRVNPKGGKSTPYMIQGGDPQGNGQGGPGYTIKDETVIGDYTAGTLAMAKSSSPNSAGSQFFINVDDNKGLDKVYNLFGHVVQGLGVAQEIQGPGDDPASKSTKPDQMTHVIVVPVAS